MSRMFRVPQCPPRSLIWLALGACLAGNAVLASDGITDADVERRATVADRVVFDAGAPGEAFDSFIVYYRGDAAAGDDTAKAAQETHEVLQKDLARVNRRLALKAKQERRLATGGHLLRLPDALDKSASERFMIEMAANPDIQAIEPNARYYPLAVPNDPHYSRQWALREATGGLNIQPAWDHSLGNGVVIAVLDTGRTPHPDLDAKTVPGYDFISSATTARDGNGRDNDPGDMGDWNTSDACSTRDSSWHGMHVAGIAGALTHNGIGIAGAAPGAWIQHVRVLGRCGGSLADIAEGMVWASGGQVAGVPNNPTPARVLNLSLGSYGSTCPQTYQNAINQVRNRGAVVVVAAGNDNASVAAASPANCNGVIAVAATDRTGRRASYSNYGMQISVAAPGGDGSGDGRIYSTVDTGSRSPVGHGYGWKSGTSMAAPYVAGVVALMLERRPSMTPAQVETMLRNTLRPFPSGCSGGCGPGIVDARAAVRAARGGSIAEYPLSVALYGNGQGKVVSTPSRIDCGSSCSARFDKGGSVTLRATPGSGYEFAGWSGACTGASATCTVSMNQAKVTFATFKIPVRTLGNGSVRSNLASSGIPLMYSIPVPAGATNLKFEISGGSGDADLHVRRGTEPNSQTYDCRPWKLGNNETCTFAAPMAGTWYAMLSGDPSFSGVRLSVSFTSAPSGGPLLSRNTPVRSISVPEGGARYYRFSVPSSAGSLRIETQGGTGDLDLYVRRGGVPTTSNYTCAPLRANSTEVCEWAVPAAGTYYIMLHGYTQVSGATLSASYIPVKTLTAGWSGAGAGSVAARRLVGGATEATCTVLPCPMPLHSNATYDLVATAATGSRFAGWTTSQCDSISAQGHCRVKMDNARRVTARFDLPAADRPIATVGRSGSGSGTVQIRRVSDGAVIGTCTNYSCRAGLPTRGTYEFIATANSNSSFDGWAAGQCSTITPAGRCRILVDRPKTVTARFSPK
ncbi:S8 family serine peptidase [Xanthomonadaceae bacterium XH05]|nr:S8 family serine peptidase [Xanthomonadaceae bacterium XH05]